MKILILAVGSYGDVLPLAGMAGRFRQWGHEVIFFTNELFSEVVRQTGAKFVAIGTARQYDEMANDPDLWHPHRGWRMLMKEVVSEKLEEAYAHLTLHLSPGNTLLISSTLGFAARLVQETHHVPHVTVHFSPGVFHSAYQAPRVPGLVLPDWLPVKVKVAVWTILNRIFIDPVVSPDLNRFRRKLGLPPVSRIFHAWLHSPDLVLGLFPEWFAPPQPDWPPNTRVTGFPLYDDISDASLPPAVQKFLDQGTPPLVFTPGSAMKHGRKFFLEAVRTCRILHHRGILLTRYPEQLPPSLPKEVAHFSYVPLSRLLPHAAALIHHGGIGTCSQALRAGIPQVIRPLAFDQFDNAARVNKLGVGASISKRAFGASLLARRLRHLLHSSATHTACHNIKKQLEGEDALRESCEMIIRALCPST